MSQSPLRRQIAWDAAQLMYFRQETEYDRARRKAARRVSRRRVRTGDLPSHAEIREQVQVLAGMYAADEQGGRLRDYRLTALRWLMRLREFAPRIPRRQLDQGPSKSITIHVRADNRDALTRQLDEEDVRYDPVSGEGAPGEQPGVIHVHDHVRVDLLVSCGPDIGLDTFPEEDTYDRRSLQELVARAYPQLDLGEALIDEGTSVDRFLVYESLLAPLEYVKQPRQHHPEGDVLYHSLQVFDLARDELPYDEEFLLAALLHDVGKAIDRRDHVGAALEVLDGTITQRTAWLIEHHLEGHAFRENTLGARARRRLREHESFEDLLLLCQCDRQGRQAGVEAPELEEAVEYIRELADTFG